MTRIAAPDELRRFAREILSSGGLRAAEAEVIAQGLVLADLRDVSSHGVARLPQYVRSIEAGDVNPSPNRTWVNDRGPVALLDADGGYGFLPSEIAIDHAIEGAETFGIGVVGVRNSHHFGMAAAYVLRASFRQKIGYVTTTSSARIAPPGTPRPVVGNNPMAWAIPRQDPHPAIVLDMALSTVAFGKIRNAAADDREIPLGWGLAADGSQTTDAKEAFESGLLEPVGAHKGYGLSVVHEVLGGCLTGSPFGLGANAHKHPSGGVGHLFTVIDPAAFQPIADFLQQVEQLVGEVKAAGDEGRSEALLPGEIEARAARRNSSGISLSDALAGKLDELARELSVDEVAPLPSPSGLGDVGDA